MDTRKVDLWNIGLIVLSLVAAFWMPVGVFLFSYAVLGPLHYLTEISWLDERRYFSQSKYTPWWLGGIMLLICLGSFYVEGGSNPFLFGFRNTIGQWQLDGLFRWLGNNMVHLLFLSMVVAVALTAVKSLALRMLVLVLGGVVGLVFSQSNAYTIWVGSMLPTLLHVCVFTGIFMLYGAMKSNSRPGYAAVLVFLAAQVCIFLLPIQPENYFLGATDPSLQKFVQSGFQQVASHMAAALGGIAEPSEFVFNSALGVRLSIFLAFIYTYHYLNWFSKTSIIQWHKVSKRKLIGALLIWGASVALYAYDYRVGLLSLLFLSLLHVVFEFPLNYVSMAGIVQMLLPGKRLKTP